MFLLEFNMKNPLCRYNYFMADNYDVLNEELWHNGLHNSEINKSISNI